MVISGQFQTMFCTRNCSLNKEDEARFQIGLELFQNQGGCNFICHYFLIFRISCIGNIYQSMQLFSFFSLFFQSNLPRNILLQYKTKYFFNNIWHVKCVDLGMHRHMSRYFVHDTNRKYIFICNSVAQHKDNSMSLCTPSQSLKNQLGC